MYDNLTLPQSQQPEYREPQPDILPKTQPTAISTQPSIEPESDFIDPDEYLKGFTRPPEDMPTPEERISIQKESSLGGMAPEKEPLSDKEALDNTETLMEVRESVQAYGLSLWVDGNLEKADEFLYSPAAKEKLIKAWSRVIGKYRMTVSPWMGVLVAEGFNTTPVILEALKQRKYRKDNEILKEQLRQYESQQQRTGMKSDYVEPAGRRDVKNQWKIDENGYFEYTEGNTYIKKDQRKRKPELTQENYELLCKHNGKEYVDQVFNIQNN